jgi:hypothetical protein
MSLLDGETQVAGRIAWQRMNLEAMEIELAARARV